jgi:hypothetical protein
LYRLRGTLLLSMHEHAAADHHALAMARVDDAPTAGTLTGSDEEHLVTYLRLLDAQAEAPSGIRSKSILCASRPQHAASGRAISHVQNGWLSTDTVDFCLMAWRTELASPASL